MKTVLTRLLTTGSVVAVDGAAGRFREVMENDYAGVIARKLDEVYRSAGSAHATSRSEKTERELRQSFIVRDNSMSPPSLITYSLYAGATQRSRYFDRTYGTFGQRCFGILRPLPVFHGRREVYCLWEDIWFPFRVT